MDSFDPNHCGDLYIDTVGRLSKKGQAIFLAMDSTAASPIGRQNPINNEGVLRLALALALRLRFEKLGL
jgi:hypothetical protein